MLLAQKKNEQKYQNTADNFFEFECKNMYRQTICQKQHYNNTHIRQIFYRKPVFKRPGKIIYTVFHLCVKKVVQHIDFRRYMKKQKNVINYHIRKNYKKKQ